MKIANPSPQAFTGAPQLGAEEFAQLGNLVREHAGINLHEGKQELVKARLNKRLRELGLSSYREYLDYLRRDLTGDEFVMMLNAISTNVTNFFREDDHFTFLVRQAFPSWRSRKAGREPRLRLWSAGCSSGEEPYTLAMVLLEQGPDLSRWDAKILATDLSTRVLNRAREGLYEESRLQEVPAALRHKYFRSETPAPGRERLSRVQPEVRRLVHFARLNFLESWPMRGPFDAIFCRNVMIYFEKPLRENLINRFWSLLEPEGYLFIGHSESLAGIAHKFKYVAPTIYQK
ncbi:MAG: protein-glutamate O-methyltransferase CheR [Candidatus Firestonebacteria bacterium]|nr:protein-glutamate O-methyltransferase CheR [Candidatus Firestonebacteria bacterium]